MLKLIEDLKNEPGKLAKIELLKKFPDKEFLKNVLEYTYNPFKIYFLKKIEIVEKPHPVSGGVNFNKELWLLLVKPLLDQLSSRQITGNAAKENGESILGVFTKESQELILKIIKKDLKAGFNVKTVNTVFPRLIPVFKVQLANKYTDFINKKKKMEEVKYFYASPKLDCLRCVFINGGLYTRNGKPIIGFDDIVAELTTLRSFDLIDGELYSHTIPFQQIQGIVMRNKNIKVDEKKQIKLNIFAMLEEKMKNTKDMIKVINDYDNTNFLTFLKHELVENNFEKIKKLNDKYVAQGYEGVMLRDVNTFYDYKRSDALLKYKSFLEEDFKIVDVYEGKKGTKYENMLGGIVVEGVYEGSKIKSECGSGWTDEDREYYWKNQSLLIGETAECRFQSLTYDKTSLRFPIFLKLKDDR